MQLWVQHAPEKRPASKPGTLMEAVLWSDIGQTDGNGSYCLPELRLGLVRNCPRSPRTLEGSGM